MIPTLIAMTTTIPAVVGAIGMMLGTMLVEMVGIIIVDLV